MRFFAMLLLGLVLAAGPVRAQETPKGWLGAGVENLTAEEAAALGWEASRGVKVSNILEGSPAMTAGLDAARLLCRVDERRRADRLARQPLRG